MSGTSLETVFQGLEGQQDPNELNAPWWMKLLHITGFLSVLFTIFAVTLHALHRLNPRVVLPLNFFIHFAYIAGVSGVAAKTGVGNCTGTASECLLFKVVFWSSHIGGFIAALQIILDGFVWGRIGAGKASEAAYYPIGGDGPGMQPLMKPQVMVSEAYEPQRRAEYGP